MRLPGGVLILFASCAFHVVVPHVAWAQTQHAHDDVGMNARGDRVMGFDHAKTTHHYKLTKTGGVIQVQANNADDAVSRDHIRMHLAYISKAFAAGDFQDPMDVHAELPPGVPVIKKRKDKIAYRYEEIERGARVVIETQDPKALEAVHEYLAYQVREHKTGDSTKVE